MIISVVGDMIIGFLLVVVFGWKRSAMGYKSSTVDVRFWSGVTELRVIGVEANCEMTVSGWVGGREGG